MIVPDILYISTG